MSQLAYAGLNPTICGWESEVLTVQQQPPDNVYSVIYITVVTYFFLPILKVGLHAGTTHTSPQN